MPSIGLIILAGFLVRPQSVPPSVISRPVMSLFQKLSLWSFSRTLAKAALRSAPIMVSRCPRALSELSPERPGRRFSAALMKAWCRSGSDLKEK